MSLTKPWHTIYQQTQHWLQANVFANIAHDLRALLRLAQGRKAQPSATILGSRTLQSTPESGTRAGYDGAKRKKGSKVHIVVDTLGQGRASGNERKGGFAYKLPTKSET
jgi:transposase